MAAGFRGQEMIEDDFPELVDILHILCNRPVDEPIVDLTIKMDQSVSEFCHLTQSKRQISVQNRLLFENRKGIRIIGRRSEALGADDMIGDVKAEPDADLKIILCAADEDFIFQKLGPVRFRYLV